MPVGTSVRVTTKVLKMKKMSTYGKGSEDAVSPVIGVILMVAITVILAAVIAAFVFGMAGNIQKTHNVAATVTRQPGNILIVTFQGGPDAASTTQLITTLDGTVNLTTAAGSATAFGAFAQPPTVGASVQTAANVLPSSGGKNHVTATATFNDGTSQVILDTLV